MNHNSDPKPGENNGKERNRSQGRRTAASRTAPSPWRDGVLPEDFGRRLERLKEAQRPLLARPGPGPGRGPQAAGPVAQGRRALRRRHALHTPLRIQDARRVGHHHGRGFPDELLRRGGGRGGRRRGCGGERGGERGGGPEGSPGLLDPRPRRAQARRRHGGV